jgi:urease accessory protein
MSTLVKLALLTVMTALFASGATAHTGIGDLSGFVSGFTHPLLGIDHVIAMVAVGMWGAFLGPPAIWLLPVVFPLVMTFGGMLGIIGVPLPGVEVGIAFSAIVLGAMVALAATPPLWMAAIIVGVFAVFHGFAHGTELPSSSDPVHYALGFVTATGLLHLLGIGFGLLAAFAPGRLVVRLSGAAIALAGVFFFVNSTV